MSGSGFTYPLAFPTYTGVKGATIRYNKVVGQSTSPGSLVTQVYEWPGERWEADIQLPVMTRANAEQWAAWLLSLRGPVGSFLMGDPSGAVPRGAASSASGSPTVSGTNSALSRTLAIATTGLGSVSNWLLPGDWIQLGSGATTRLYKNLTAASLVANAVTLDITPPLRVAPNPGDPVVVSGALGKFMLSSGQVQHAIDNALHFTPATIAAVEDLR
ncbi:MAG TPA: hypothetical protein VFB13_17870 [Reyranella sp.]|jgi:hypothetical protein|nr:hypothetical protein [Reyranella sp.]